MLFSLGPYEILIIAGAFAVITLGPVAAGLVLAWVRRRRAKKQQKT
ncbi:MAG: hypothetical protein KF878_18775 [Planctomycetes bacterium]|nr:hypothetical protein [Planctomycetota bacterium]